MDTSICGVDLATTLGCPTCGTEQEWSDTCRRCRCDLTLLRAVEKVRREHRRRCLLLLRAGRLTEALQQARRGYALCADQRSARLLAVCHLVCGNWTRAITLAPVSRKHAAETAS